MILENHGQVVNKKLEKNQGRIKIKNKKIIMKKEEMRKIVDEELKTLMPPGLNEIQQKLWRFCFNMIRQNDLAQENPKSGEVINRECIERLKQANSEDFPPDQNYD